MSTSAVVSITPCLAATAVGEGGPVSATHPVPCIAGRSRVKVRLPVVAEIDYSTRRDEGRGEDTKRHLVFHASMQPHPAHRDRDSATAGTLK
jgi:hypothetical protein